MLSISTIQEALAKISELTSREWTESELFDLVTNRGILLHAALPLDAPKETITFTSSGQKNTAASTSILVVLHPFQIAQLWVSGVTESSRPHAQNLTGGITLLTKPVRITRAEVRLRSDTVSEILKVWNTAQSGTARQFGLPEWVRNQPNPEKGKGQVKTEKELPWLIHKEGDLEPKQPWYTPARYFARELIRADSTLLRKRGTLADKVSQSLSDVGIYKRGRNKQKLDGSTVKKSFSNITFD